MTDTTQDKTAGKRGAEHLGFELAEHMGCFIVGIFRFGRNQLRSAVIGKTELTPYSLKSVYGDFICGR